MRFQFLLSVSLLAGIVPILALPFQYADANDLEVRYNDRDASLVSRGYLDVEDDLALVRRTGRGSGRTGGRNRQGPPPLGPPHNTPESAKAAYHNTANKPAAHDTFHTKTGAVYTGEHVNKAIEEFHRHNPTPGGHDTGSAGKGHPKEFKNRPNKSTGERPFPNAGPGKIKEFPLMAGGKGYREGKTGNSRIIMQENGSGGHNFLGVTGHGKPGENMEDHHVAPQKQYKYNDADHSAAFHRMFNQQ